MQREVLAHAGCRWSLGLVHELGVYGRVRHAEIGRRMQRILTLTLRQLERDGLVLRRDCEEVPRRVDYELTDIGMELLTRMVSLHGLDRRNCGANKKPNVKRATATC